MIDDRGRAGPGHNRRYADLRSSSNASRTGNRTSRTFSGEVTRAPAIHAETLGGAAGTFGGSEWATAGRTASAREIHGDGTSWKVRRVCGGDRNGHSGTSRSRR